MARSLAYLFLLAVVGYALWPYECQDFRVGYGIACSSRIRCRQHIVTELS
jgi:hypothetical protein